MEHPRRARVVHRMKKTLLLATVVLMAVITPGCSLRTLYIPDWNSRPYKPKPHIGRNMVQTFYGTAYQVCADRSHSEFGSDLRGLHAHLVSRAMVDGVIDEGDRLLVYTDGASKVYSTTNLRNIVTIQFPAGLGGHTVRFQWVDVAGREKAAAETYVSVWGCLPEGDLALR